MAKILVTDGNYPHTLGIVKSLSLKGHQVDCIGSKFCLSFFSKYLKKLAYEKRFFNSTNLERFLTFLKKENYDFLIPIGAESISFISKNRKIISDELIINIPPNKSIEICLNKNKTNKFAEKKGIKIPKVYTRKFLLNYILDNERLPSKLVVKSNKEISNMKVQYISSIKDFKELNFQDEEVIIQEYIDGIGIGFFAIYENGQLKKYFMHERIREYPITGGSSVCAKSIYDKEVYHYGKLLLDNLNWHGVGMVEFKKNKIKNKLYLMEINPKFWGSHDLSISSGINFAEEYLRLNLKRQSENKFDEINGEYKVNNKFQWPARDIVANIKNPSRLISSIKDLFNPNVQNNLSLRDFKATIYLLIYAVTTPILNTKKVSKIRTLIYRIINFGIKIALIRTFTEVTGIPILKYSKVTNKIAFGMQPKFLGYILLKTRNYKYILNLRTKKNPATLNKFFNIKNISVEEYTAPSIKQLNNGADFIKKVLNENGKIYIHCREGISRAPTFLAAYFIKYEKYTLEEAIKKLLSTRDFINILPSQLKKIKAFEKSYQFKNN